MLYSNILLESKPKTYDFGTIYQIGMGQFGRGRKFMTLTCPMGTIIREGMNPEYSIEFTQSRKPKIVKRTDSTIFMLLSSKGRHARKGSGTIRVLQSQKSNFEVLKRGKGAEGATGRMGFWDCMLLRVPDGDSIVRVRTSGGGYGTPSDLYLVHNCCVFHCYLDQLVELCNALGVNVPCKILYEENGVRFGKDWAIL